MERDHYGEVRDIVEDWVAEGDHTKGIIESYLIEILNNAITEHMLNEGADDE